MSAITLEQVLSTLQIVGMLIGFLGMAFTLGRVFQGLSEIRKDVAEIKFAMFGGDKQEGIFLRRAEADLLLLNADRARANFDKRLEELNERLGGLDQRVHVVEVRRS